MQPAEFGDDPAPADLPQALAKSLKQAARGNLWKALASDLRKMLSHSQKTMAHPSPEMPSILTKSLSEARSGVIEKRAATNRAFQGRAAGRNGGRKSGQFQQKA